MLAWISALASSSKKTFQNPCLCHSFVIDAKLSDDKIPASQQRKPGNEKMNNKIKLVAVLGLNKNVIREAKQVGDKFYAWVQAANHGAGEWQRVAKTKIQKVEA
jgi:hypothetical protein